MNIIHEMEKFLLFIMQLHHVTHGERCNTMKYPN